VLPAPDASDPGLVAGIAPAMRGAGYDAVAVRDAMDADAMVALEEGWDSPSGTGRRWGRRSTR
jgi:hypothetical protein